MLPGGTYREEYLTEALEWRWKCRNKSCGVWNSDKKEFRVLCSACGALRPRSDMVERYTKGKR